MELVNFATSTVKNSVAEIDKEDRANSCIMYRFSAIINLLVIIRSLKDAIPAIKQESNKKMKVWYIISTTVIVVGYVFYTGNCMLAAHYCNELEKRDNLEDAVNNISSEDESSWEGEEWE